MIVPLERGCASTLKYPGRSLGRDKRVAQRSKPLEMVRPSRTGRDYGRGIGWLKGLRRTERASPGAGRKDLRAERDGGDHECGGPWSRGSVCLEACSDWGGEIWLVQGGERLLAPGSEPWQHTWIGEEVLGGVI